MSLTSYVCPRCDAVLKTANPLAAGRTIKCSKCGTSFAIGAEKPRPAVRKAVPVAAPVRAAKRVDDDRDEDERPRSRLMDGSPRKKGRKQESRSNALAVALIAVGAIVLLGGGGLLIYALNGDDESNTVASNTDTKPSQPAKKPTSPEGPVEPPPETKPAPATKPQPVDTKPQPKPPDLPVDAGKLTSALRDKVKQATVYIRVTLPEGVGSGTGFFGLEKGNVITNAHVIGMEDPGSPPPLRIEVFQNSGESDEIALTGQVLAVDRERDLAVLRVARAMPGASALPDPLPFSPADKLELLEPVYVFGFPFGEQLGKNISASPSSVASLRRKQGRIDEVQLNGGMHPGNSGGPIVNAKGEVVAVARAGLRATTINFAIPVEATYQLQHGRIAKSGMQVGYPYRKNDQIVIPVSVETIDPFNRLSKVAIECWYGDPGQPRPPSKTKPGPQTGDLEQRYTTILTRSGNTATGEIVLPAEAPMGKVLWVQPMIVSLTQGSHWDEAQMRQPEPPVDRKAATLAFKHQKGVQVLDLKSKDQLKFRGPDGREHSFLHNIEAKLIESTLQVDPRSGSAAIQLTVGKLDFGISIDGQGPPRSDQLQKAINDLRFLAINLTVDKQNNIQQKSTDIRRAPPTSRDTLEELGDQILHSLDAVAVPINGGAYQPGQTWTAKRMFGVDTPDSLEPGTLNMTYTFEGVRMRDNREEAVISMKGYLRGIRQREVTLSGQARGTAFVDVATGRVVKADNFADVTLEVERGDKSFVASGTLETHLTRGGMAK